MFVHLDTINENIRRNPAAFVQETNAAYLRQLQEIAGDIARHRAERPIILLSGPSGSGKTTTALMLEAILDEQGIQTHTLSLDNYFSPFTDEERELFAAGKLDLESPQRVDQAFLTEQMQAIYDCQPVRLPVYDFKESVRHFEETMLHRKPDELVILEGIHSLNPAILNLPDEVTARIYVSVRTRICHNGEVLHPSKIRLMRRLVRDQLFRKRSFADTISMFRYVEEGENKYIMPFKYRSSYDVDTFMAYEICAYQEHLAQALQAFPDEPIVQDICRFLKDTLPFSEIPPDSLICEFIGQAANRRR